MKRRFSILFSLLLALCLIGTLLPASALAAETISLDSVYLSETAPTVEANHIYLDGYCTDCGLPEGMTYTVYGDTVSISKYTGSLKEVIIPATIEGKDVTAIHGFKGTAVEKVILPNTVDYIGSQAFYGCTALSQIIIPNGLTTIREYAFYGCTALSKIDLPDSVTQIGYRVFSDCTALTQFTVPNGVTKIDEYTFANCPNLTKLTISDNVTKVDGSAFVGSDIKELIIKEGSVCVTTDIVVCKDTLEKVTIPSTVTEIGESAFFRCYGLTEITLPAGLKKFGHEAFAGCRNILEITIPDGVTEIGEEAFAGCKMFTQLTIPDSVTTIDTHAFSSCENLTQIKLPANITKIDNYTFAFCEALPQLTIPDSVTSIGDYAFYDCNALTQLTIPSGVTYIGEQAFSYRTAPIQLTFKGNLPTFGSECFLRSAVTVAYPCGNDTWTDTAIADLTAAHPTVTWVVAHTPVSGTCTGCGEPVFADIDENGWQYPFAQYAVENGLMAGKGTDEDGNIIFDPNSPIKREEFVQVLYNAEGKPAISIANPFPDVADGGWYKNAVLWAKQNDIASGKGNGNFGVGENISRQDLAMMLYKYAKLNGYSLDATDGLINQFADGDMVASYATGAMDWAVTNGIMSGKGAAGADLSTFRLDPTGIATRAECAAMLKNFQTAFGG